MIMTMKASKKIGMMANDGAPVIVKGRVSKTLGIGFVCKEDR